MVTSCTLWMDDQLSSAALTLTEFPGQLVHLLLVGLGLLGGRLRVPHGLHARVVRADLVLRRLVLRVPLNGIQHVYLGGISS